MSSLLMSSLLMSSLLMSSLLTGLCSHRQSEAQNVHQITSLYSGWLGTQRGAPSDTQAGI
jgi:hypothetical protein